MICAGIELRLQIRLERREIVFWIKTVQLLYVFILVPGKYQRNMCLKESVSVQYPSSGNGVKSPRLREDSPFSESDSKIITRFLDFESYLDETLEFTLIVILSSLKL